MIYFYSKSTQGFYQLGFHTPEQIPTDAVEITQEQYEDLFTQQSVGGTIVPNDDGYPVIIPISLETQKNIIIQNTKITNYVSDISTISYPSEGGITTDYQSDPNSANILQGVLLGFSFTQTVPTGFYWIAKDNTQVPFTYQDLQQLYTAIQTLHWEGLQRLQQFKTAVNDAITLEAAQAIVW